MGNFTGIRFQLDTSELKKLAPLLKGKELPKLVRAGLQYAAKSTPPAVGRNVAAHYGIGSRRVQQDVRGPYVSGTGEEIEAKIYFSRRPATGMQFKPRESKSGVSFSFYKSEKTKVQGSFIQTVKNGRLPFKPDRTKLQKPQPGRKKPRYALKTIYGPSTGSMYLGQSKHGGEIRENVDKRINEQFNKGIERRVKSILRGYGFK
jgi:hypothetical protein